jgi:protease-4
MHLFLLLATTAFGQAVGIDRPVIPSAGYATESGPGALWVNPANVAYDPDRRFGLWVGQDLERDTAIAATWGTGGINLGAYNHIRSDGTADWSLDYAAGIALPRRFAVGTRVGWHLMEGEPNFVSFDVGGSWRPLPWFGVGAVAQNIGTPDPAAVARSGAGIALRPFADLLVLGADYVRTFPPDGADEPTELARFTARIRPIEGLYLRGSVDNELTVGAGLELYFDGVGLGAHGAMTDAQDIGLTGWVGSDEPGESLFRSGKKVPTLDLRSMPDYEPPTGLLARREPSWLDVLELLRRVEKDRGIRGVVITLGEERASWARTQELRDRILSLEGAGKKVVVYLYGAPSNGAYYAASAASRVFLHPASHLQLQGLSAELVHFRGTLDLLGIEPQFVRQAEYKSAVEPFTRTEPSPQQLEQTEALLEDFYQELVSGLAAGRGVSSQQAAAWIDGGPWTGREALEMGMVDEMAYPAEVEDLLDDLHGTEVHTSRLDKTHQPRSPWEPPAQIAVVYVERTIVTGESSPDGLLSTKTAGSRTVVRQLARAEEDPLVRAVVLRVDSPGGSAFASDEIWRAVARLQEEGKPVVVSMGGVAASGGYYISAGADAIWAQPTTITGSIGALSWKLTTGDMLGRIGVTSTTLTRGRNASIDSFTEPWDPVQEARVQAQVDDVYRQFTDKVAEGRGLDSEEVDQVARGRVWSGRRAHEIGLVDGLGGFEEAISDARERAGISPRRKVGLVTYPRGAGSVESLSPALLKVLGPLPDLLTLRGTSRPGIAVPDVVSGVWEPLLLWGTLEDEGALLIDPYPLEVEPR